MRADWIRNGARVFSALALVILSVTWGSSVAWGVGIGVVVDNVPGTLPPTAEPPPAEPPVTEPPSATTVPPTTPPTTSPQTNTAPTTTPPPTTAAPKTTGAPTTLPLTTDDSLVAELPPPSEVTIREQSGFAAVVSSVKSAAKITSNLVRNVAGGQAVADAAAELLPGGVADVLVPAIRTASTFAFPIGLAGAVLGFLGLQSRIDAGDPKLSAAPMAHDDDQVLFS